MHLPSITDCHILSKVFKIESVLSNIHADMLTFSWQDVHHHVYLSARPHQTNKHIVNCGSSLSQPHLCVFVC